MAKRFTSPTIRWSDLDKLVPPEQKGKFLAFKGKSEAYLRRVEANPPEPPKIDWDLYKKLVPIPDLVEKLRSAYKNFKVPYPNDNMSEKVDKQWEELQPQICEYCAKQQKIIDEAQKEVDRIKALPPFDQITLEMFYDLYPGVALDPVNRPTFWPHTDDEQLGYVPPEQQVQQKKK